MEARKSRGTESKVKRRGGRSDTKKGKIKISSHEQLCTLSSIGGKANKQAYRILPQCSVQQYHNNITYHNIT